MSHQFPTGSFICWKWNLRRKGDFLIWNMTTSHENQELSSVVLMTAVSLFWGIWANNWQKWKGKIKVKQGIKLNLVSLFWYINITDSLRNKYTFLYQLNVLCYQSTSQTTPNKLSTLLATITELTNVTVINSTVLIQAFIQFFAY